MTCSRNYASEYRKYQKATESMDYRKGSRLRILAIAHDEKGKVTKGDKKDVLQN